MRHSQCSESKTIGGPSQFADSPQTGDAISNGIVPESRTLWQRCLDNLFGRDFFISYRWSDARDYALQLAVKLKAERFDCFLDSDGFLKGDHWQRIGDRELRKTSRLVLLASPEVHQSEAVERELRVFSARGRRIFVIEFGDALSPARFPGSPVLQLLGLHVIRQQEPEAALRQEPSEAVINELRRTFEGETSMARRLRAIQAAAALLMLLLILAGVASLLAWSQYRSKLTSAAADDARRATVHSGRMETDEAAALFARSMIRNPKDQGVMGALTRFVQEQPPVRPRMLMSGNFKSAAISDSGDRIMLLDESGTVMVFNGNMQHPETLNLPSPVTQFAASRNGKYAVGMSRGQMVRIDCDSLKAGVSLKARESITVVSVNDAGRIAAGTGEGHVYVSEEQSAEWKALGKLRGAVSSLVFSSDEPLRLAAADGSDYKVWTVGAADEGNPDEDPGEDIPDEAPEDEMEDTTNFIAELEISPDGTVWQAECNEDLNAVQFLRTIITARSATELSSKALFDGDPFYYARVVNLNVSDDGTRCLARLDSDEVLACVTPDEEHRRFLADLQIEVLSSGGKSVATVREDGRLQRWLTSGLHPAGSAAPLDGIRSLCTDASGNRMVLLTNFGAFWMEFPAISLADYPVGRQWVPVIELPSSFKRWRTDDSGDLRQDPSTSKHEGVWLRKLATGPVARYVHPLSPEDRKAVEIIEERMMEPGNVLPVEPECMAAASRDRLVAATAAGSAPVRVWYGDWHRPVCEIPVQEGSDSTQLVAQLRISDDGTRVLVSTVDNLANASRLAPSPACRHVIYDVRSGKRLFPLLQLSLGEKAWDFTADLRFAIVSSDAQIRVHDCSTGETVGTPIELKGPHLFIGFEPGGTAFLIATRSGNLRIWRTTDGLPLTGILQFDPDANPEQAGSKHMDAYQISMWAERNSKAESPLRRIAVRIENDNRQRRPDGSVARPGFLVFDISAIGTDRDHVRFAELVMAVYGVSISDKGIVAAGAGQGVAKLSAAYLAPKLWDSLDMERLSKWLIDGRCAEKPGPLTAE